MKTNFYNYGQSLIGIIIVLIAVGLIGGGLYYYLQKQIPEVPEIPQKPSEEVVTPEEKVVTPLEEELPKGEVEAEKPKIEKPGITKPEVEIEATFELKSKFLQADPMAQAIASGKIKNYDVRKFSSVYHRRTNYSTNNFAYRFLSALRMLGYIRGNRPVSGSDYVTVLYLNRAQRFNNLTPTPFIDGPILKIIDSALAEKENLDKKTALKFPLYNHLVGSPLNEPTKEHLASLLVITFEELPSHLVVWSEKNFKDFYVALGPLGSTNQVIKNIDRPDYQICDNAYYPEFGQECTTAKDFDGNTLINKVLSDKPYYDDFSYASMMLHEYAHYLDGVMYGRESGTSRGIIDTSSFYNISFDTSDPAPNNPSQFSYRRPQNIQNEFVSYDAQGGWKYTYPGSEKEYSVPAEDFAESFEMYVTDGKVFRKLSESNDILKQKYDWLKINVFNGQEYQSGDIQSIAVLRQQPGSYDAAIQSTGAPKVIEYSTSLPDFVWNYKFLNGSFSSKP